MAAPFNADSSRPAAAVGGSTQAARRVFEHPLRVPHFRNLWIGSTISLLGDQFYLVALPWLVLQLTGSTLALGAILMSAAVPRAVLVLAGGVLTDRFAPRRVLIATASTRAVLVAAVAGLAWLKVIHLWHIYVLAFLFGTADAFSFPAVPALIPTLVAAEQLPAANSVFQSSTHLSGLLGPAPAGMVVKAWGVAQAFFVDALSFLFVIAALWRVPERPHPAAVPGSGVAPPRPSMLSSIAEGLRYVRNDSALWALILLTASLNFCMTGPISIGLAAMAKFRFGSAAAFGTLLSCFSGGALAGMILAGIVARPPRRGLLLIGISFVMGLGLLVVAVDQRFAPIAVTLVLMGIGAGFVNVQIVSWMQSRVERQIIGRVMSVLMFSAVGMLPISLLVAGAVAQRHLAAMFLGSAVLMLVVGVVAGLTPGVRQIE